MQFDYLDEHDERIVDCAPYARVYHRDLEDAPRAAGVYIFLDADGDVIYVGCAEAGKLSSEIEMKWNTSVDLGARRYRWFSTANETAACALEANWIEKYRPRNNVVDEPAEPLRSSC